MNATTDPARELADLCNSLIPGNPKEKGYAFLAGTFDVKAWSAEFYQIVFTILHCFDELSAIIDTLELDDDLHSAAIGHIERIKLAFSDNGLNNEWQHSTTNFLSRANVSPIAMLSPTVRLVQSYPRIVLEEANEIIGLVDELLSWLRDRQIAEQDFIRQALIEGLKSFRFRMSRVQWLGWGYTLQSLRDVIAAYLVLEGYVVGDDHVSEVRAVLERIKSAITWIYDKIGFAKDVRERANLLVEAYKWASTSFVTAKAGVLLIGGHSG